MIIKSLQMIIIGKTKIAIRLQEVLVSTKIFYVDVSIHKAQCLFRLQQRWWLPLQITGSILYKWKMFNRYLLRLPLWMSLYTKNNAYSGCSRHHDCPEHKPICRNGQCIKPGPDTAIAANLTSCAPAGEKIEEEITESGPLEIQCYGGCIRSEYICGTLSFTLNIFYWILIQLSQSAVWL